MILNLFSNHECEYCKKSYPRKTGIKHKGKRYCSDYCLMADILDLIPSELEHIKEMGEGSHVVVFK